MSRLLFLLRWQERQGRVERGTGTLLTFLGDMAYDEARGRTWACWAKRDGDGDRFWSRVAVSIAKRSGREIGVKAADRYLWEANPHARARARREHEAAQKPNAILAALAEIAHGRDVRTGLHNVSAQVRIAEALVIPEAALAASGVALVPAATDLAATEERSSGLVGQGLYPPELEAVGHAVEQWRAALLKAARR